MILLNKFITARHVRVQDHNFSENRVNNGINIDYTYTGVKFIQYNKNIIYFYPNDLVVKYYFSTVWRRDMSRFCIQIMFRAPYFDNTTLLGVNITDRYSTTHLLQIIKDYAARYKILNIENIRQIDTCFLNRTDNQV